ncbi:MAG TPA: FHA domain-containing protein [Dehalococcoidia bacterium]|nr:FHA domain-containing protein [Dehalococcoidia bacterium]
MLESQGTRTLDPYRTLQLHPSAPRQLIVEAYWHLISRRNPRDKAGLAGDLNAAYALLMDEDRRAAYDREHGYDAARGGHTSSPLADYYERLHIDREADAAIVALAYAATAREPAADVTPDRREAIDEAYRILRNPQLRAQYDAASGAEALSVPVPTVVAPPARPPDTDVPPAPPAAVTSSPLAVATQALSPPPTQRRGLMRRLGVGAAPPPRPMRGIPRRYESDQALDAAKDARLLALEGEPLDRATVAVAGSAPSPGDEDAIASLGFIAGPFAGLRIGLGTDVLTIGSSAGSDVVLSDQGDRIAPEHARVWCHGDHVVFHQLQGARSVVAGRRLETSLVILDDGDEIQIGQHRMTFTRTHLVPA